MAKKLEKPYEEKNIEIFKKYLKNNYPNDHDIAKITKENIYKIIDEAKKTNGDDYSLSWKKAILFSLSSYFEKNKMETKHEYILSKARQINKKINNIEENQDQTEKEVNNYLSYYELRNYLDKYKNYKHIDDMYKYLLLACLCTDQEPLRPQIYINLNYVNESKQIKNDDKNYIYVSKQGKSGCFYINNDKVNEHEEHKEHKRIRLNKEFLSIIAKSFKDYPRCKLFNFDVKQAGDKILNIFHTITGTKFNFQMARSSFITYKNLENPNMSYKQKKTLALNMRHSKQTQEKNYLKHNLTITDKTMAMLKKEFDDKYLMLKNSEKTINNNINKINEYKINNNYEKQNVDININNEDIKQRILLKTLHIDAIIKKYDDMLHEISEKIKEYEDLNCVLLGNYKNDTLLLLSTENKLKKCGHNKKAEKIHSIVALLSSDEEYDKNKLNTDIYNIIFGEEVDIKINKKRRDIIYHANKNRTKICDNNGGYKKIKGVITPENMHKYNIVFNEETNKYE